MKRALVVGVDHYTHLSNLFGCVNDAHAVNAVLERHSDGSVNFGVRLLTGTGPSAPVLRADLKDAIEWLFADKMDIALFYFAGHGDIGTAGGYILATDASRGDEGVALAEILTFANGSPAGNKIIVLDSCHSGVAGNLPGGNGNATLSEGLTILTASTAGQYAAEENARGVFTTLFVDALNGAAANLVGDITPGSVYAHIDQSLGSWAQRPVFKTNVDRFVSLRKVQPPISLADLQCIKEFFPESGHEFKLDPTFEPEVRGRAEGMPAPDPENTRKFAILQRFNRVNLVVPVDAPHMWHAAMESKVCRLTVLGEHYRRLASKGQI